MGIQQDILVRIEDRMMHATDRGEAMIDKIRRDERVAPIVGHALVYSLSRIEVAVLARAEELLTPEAQLEELYDRREQQFGEVVS